MIEMSQQRLLLLSPNLAATMPAASTAVRVKPLLFSRARGIPRMESIWEIRGIHLNWTIVRHFHDWPLHLTLEQHAAKRN